MSQTIIEWTARPGPDRKLRPGYTFNPWIGCTVWGPECENCYAASLDALYQYGGATHWGKGVPRHLTSPDNWKNPIRWNKKAKREGWRPAVFCASMADWADQEVDFTWQTELMQLVKITPHLEWLLLTKRPANAKKILDFCFPDGIPDHVRVGTTCGAKVGLKRVEELLKIDASLFISAEPLLEEVDLYPFLGNTRIDQVIAGGESGVKARPTNPQWVKSIQLDCWRAGVPFFMKQWGEWAPEEEVQDEQARAMCRLGNVKAHEFPGMNVYRVGKKTAGCTLEGKVIQQQPRQPLRLTIEGCTCNACASN